jgi:kojibiose phosphorylase
MTRIDAFIFDLDGVLTDTAECHYQGWKRLADEHGIPFTRQENEALRGVSRRESLNLLLKGRPVSEEQALEMMERKNSYYLELVSQMTPEDVLPGAREFLVAVRAAGIKIAIASASKNAQLVVSRLDLHDAIDILTDGNSVQRTKPAPDLFLFAAKQLGVEPENAVIVEDAEAGIQAAKAAGMRSVGLGPIERVGGADVVLPDLTDANLPELIAALS